MKEYGPTLKPDQRQLSDLKTAGSQHPLCITNRGSLPGACALKGTG